MATPNSLERFSDRARDYAQCRPSYPEATVLKFLEPFTLNNPAS